MEINYKNLENEIVGILKNNKKWVLSTCENDYVTSRTMSIINDGLDIYFQTNKCYVKYDQMENNPKISLCFSNVSIEGAVEFIGDWNTKANSSLRELYEENHKSSFDAYGFLENQVVCKVNVHKVKLWKYLDGKPFREILDVANNSAIQLDFM